VQAKVKVIIGNTVHDTAFYPHGQWNKNTFSEMSIVNDLIRNLSKSLFNISDDSISGILQSYHGLSPQNLWNTVTADMRVTCPLNSLAESMSKSPKHEIYRLFVTYGLSPDFQVYHGWEVEALFGFKFRESRGDSLPKNSRGRKFRGLLVDMLKQFANDGVTERGWQKFPDNTLIIDDSDNMKTLTKTPPNDDHCVKLAEKSLDRYGWQN
jgi:hypothetical protein